MGGVASINIDTGSFFDYIDVVNLSQRMNFEHIGDNFLQTNYVMSDTYEDNDGISWINFRNISIDLDSVSSKRGFLLRHNLFRKTDEPLSYRVTFFYDDNNKEFDSVGITAKYITPTTYEEHHTHRYDVTLVHQEIFKTMEETVRESEGRTFINDSVSLLTLHELGIKMHGITKIKIEKTSERNDFNIIIKQINGLIHSTKNEHIMTFPILLKFELAPDMDYAFVYSRMNFIDGKFVINNDVNNALLYPKVGTLFFDTTSIQGKPDVLSHKFDMIIDPLPNKDQKYYFEIKTTSVAGIDHYVTIEVHDNGNLVIHQPDDKGSLHITTEDPSKRAKEISIFRNIGVARFEITKLNSYMDNLCGQNYKISLDMIANLIGKEICAPTLFGPNRMSYMDAFETTGSIKSNSYDPYYQEAIMYSYKESDNNEYTTGSYKFRNGFIDINSSDSDLVFILNVSKKRAKNFPSDTKAIISFKMAFTSYCGCTNSAEFYLETFPDQNSEKYTLDITPSDGEPLSKDIKTFRRDSDKNTKEIMLKINKNLLRKAGFSMKELQQISFVTDPNITNIDFSMNMIKMLGEYTYDPNFHIITDKVDDGSYGWKLYRDRNKWGIDKFLYAQSRIKKDSSKFFTHLPQGYYTFGFTSLPTSVTSIKSYNYDTNITSNIKTFDPLTKIGKVITLFVDEFGIITEYLHGEIIDNIKLEFTVPSAKRVTIKIYEGLTGWKDESKLVRHLDITFGFSNTNNLIQNLLPGKYVIGIESENDAIKEVDWKIYDIFAGNDVMNEKIIIEKTNQTIDGLCMMHYIIVNPDSTLRDGLKYNKFNNKGVLRTDNLKLFSNANFNNSGSVIIDNDIELIGDNSVLNIHSSGLASIGGTINIKTNGTFDTDCNCEPTSGVIVRGGYINTNDGKGNQDNTEPVKIDITGNSGIYFLPGDDDSSTNIPGGLVINNKLNEGDVGYIAPDANVIIGNFTISNDKE